MWIWSSEKVLATTPQNCSAQSKVSWACNDAYSFLVRSHLINGLDRKGGAEAVLYHDMRYTVYQDIRYTSALSVGSLLGRLVGSPKGDRRAFPTARGLTSVRVHPW